MNKGSVLAGSAQAQRRVWPLAISVHCRLYAARALSSALFCVGQRPAILSADRQAFCMHSDLDPAGKNRECVRAVFVAKPYF